MTYLSPALPSALIRNATRLAALFLLSGTPLLQAGQWQPLFNGKNLEGWETRNGTAEFFVEDGVLIGEAKLNTPNTFLCTKDTYGDFILEFEIWGDVGLNSGVQIRSLSDPDYRNGRVHGYQVEIDPSPRAWSGGIYDEARRGWIYPLTRSEASRQAFRNGEWNHFRVEAVGSSIRTWINGIQCAHLIDDMTAEGFIGLQVHSIPREDQVGLKIRFRDIRIMTEDLEAHRKPNDADVELISYLENTLTEEEIRKGWRLLWDGRTSKGWRRVNDTGFPEAGWVMENGQLIVLATPSGQQRKGGDIVTVEQFSSFELELDFMITEGANSGIKYFVVEQPDGRKGTGLGLEYQILDDRNHPDAQKGVAGNRTVASLYDMIAAENLSNPMSRNKIVNGPGAWNKARVVVRGNQVEHWLNNIKVVEFDRGSQMYRALVAFSKYAELPNFGEAPDGHILLQDHNDRVAFRSIKIREL